MRKFKTIRILTVAIYLCLPLFAGLPYPHNNLAKADFPSLNKILQNDPMLNLGLVDNKLNGFGTIDLA
jgi:hypothetical protein